jgi:hypothetical protein
MTVYRGLLTTLAVLANLAGCRTSADESFLSNGVKINYAVHGQGEPVILIHGWLSSGWINWDLPGTTKLLAKDHQVVWLDLPAHGRSDKPTKEEAYGPELVEHVPVLILMCVAYCLRCHRLWIGRAVCSELKGWLRRRARCKTQHAVARAGRGVLGVRWRTGTAQVGFWRLRLFLGAVRLGVVRDNNWRTVAAVKAWPRGVRWPVAFNASAMRREVQPATCQCRNCSSNVARSPNWHHAASERRT